MPKIIIREKDYTRPGLADYENFTVVVPGFVLSGYHADVFDENGIYEVSSSKDFKENVGAVLPKAFTYDSLEIPAHYGNQIAYELLRLGYTVLYVNIGEISINAGTGDITFSNTTAYNRFLEYYGDGTENVFEPLKDKANYDFRFVVSGLINSNASVNEKIIDLVEFNESQPNADDNGRGDCVALIDIPEEAYFVEGVTKSSAEIIKAIALAAASYPSKYAAVFAPTLCYADGIDTKFINNNKFPASFHYLVCFNRSIQNSFREWYAIAGLTRGLSEYTVDSTSVKLGDPAINALEPRTQKSLGEVTVTVATNVIVKIRGQYYLWGNRTGHLLGEATTSDLIASDFLNIRQLCTTLKKELYVACRRFTFDPNSDTLWTNFCNAIRPTLEAMKADQGIDDYEIIRVVSTKKAELKARVRIVPIEAVEDFDIELSLEDSLGATTLSISE